METIDKLDAKSPIVEAYRSVRTSIEYSNLDDKLKVILVTSTQQNEGKSTVASNLAISFSKLPNKKILLIDGDLRNPSIHRVFSIGNSDGMMSILKGEKDLKSTINTFNDNLSEVDNNYDIVLQVKPEKVSKIKSEIINGQKCIIIPVDEDEHTNVNGVENLI